MTSGVRRAACALIDIADVDELRYMQDRIEERLAHVVDGLIIVPTQEQPTAIKQPRPPIEHTRIKKYQ